MCKAATPGGSDQVSKGLDTLEEAGGGGDPESSPVSSKGLMARTSRLSCRRSYVLNSTVNNSTRQSGSGAEPNSQQFTSDSSN